MLLCNVEVARAEQREGGLHEVPLLATHGTLVVWLLKPFYNAVHVKAMLALPKHCRRDWGGDGKSVDHGLFKWAFSHSAYAG